MGNFFPVWEKPRQYNLVNGQLQGLALTAVQYSSEHPVWFSKSFNLPSLEELLRNESRQYDV